MDWQAMLTWQRLVLFMVVVFLLFTIAEPFAKQKLPIGPVQQVFEEGIRAWCPLPEPRAVSLDDGLASPQSFWAEESLQLQVERLSAAVNVATVSYTDNGSVEEDPRWTAFEEFHKVLRDLFPLVHEKLELEMVNKYGLLYTLQGSASNLKPVIFMAHQDVVPAASPFEWAHPPYEAYFDGTWLWGRGSVDCKNNLIGLLSTMESLLAQDFKNKRTIIFSFGFDEETGGMRGAKYLSEHIERKLGKNSVAMILDEGGMGINTVGDVTFALPSTAEKGYIDIVMTLQTPGGHSSRPPPHSGIGIMSDLVLTLEKNPFTPILDDANPHRNVLECEAKYLPKQSEPWLKKALQESSSTELAQQLVDSRGESARWVMQTSQAVDMIVGGVQDNQLPERVVTTINYRVLPSDDIDKLLSDVAELLAPVAHSYGVSVDGFGRQDVFTDKGLLNLTSHSRLSPSPISPTGADVGIWNLFAGTIRQVYENTTGPSQTEPGLVVVAGDIMTGNTDTIHYWPLSSNIYRFSPRREGTTEGVHTIDERIDMRTHVEAMALYYELIRNLDRYDGE